jgi:D-serine deaminase-like pyridoxal phosphate-dependent protein
MTEPRRVDQLSTPALLVDLDAFEANVAAADALLRDSGKTLRPHLKTHRTPGLALRQLTVPTAAGVTCATVGEAEAMVEAGGHDVLLANEIASPEKAERLARLAASARVIAAADSPGVVEALAEGARRAGHDVEVIVDVDVGLGRCGVAHADGAVSLAKLIDQTPGVRVVGLMGYEGRIRADDDERADKLERTAVGIAEAKAAMDAAGFDTSIVSSAGTSTLLDARADPLVTEIQAGTYVMMESDLDGLELPFVPSLWLVAAVISAGRGHVVLDAGRKSMASDYGRPSVVGAGTEGARVVKFHEEHTTVEWPGELPALDTRIMLQPKHVRLTCNLHDELWLVRGDEVVERLPVSARGRSR